MIIRIRCSDPMGLVVLRMLAATEQIAQGIEVIENTQRMLSAVSGVTAIYKPEDLQFETQAEARKLPAKVHYWAKLPKLADGTFDMTEVDKTVKENLLSIGAHTVNGIIYQDIVTATLMGGAATERDMRDKHGMPGGSSQRAVQQLFHTGVIDRGPVEVAG